MRAPVSGWSTAPGDPDAQARGAVEVERQLGWFAWKARRGC